MISPKDKEILRQIAARKREMAQSTENDRILAQFRAQAAGRRDTPPVRLLFSNFTREVIDPRMQCEGDLARNLERRLLDSLVGRELFGDDTPLSPCFEIPLMAWVDPFGTPANLTRVKNSSGFHINPVTDDIEADFSLFTKGHFICDLAGTQALAAAADETFGDILPAKIVMSNLSGAITNPLVMLIGLQNYYMAMYDAPDTLHKIMNLATEQYLAFYDHLEQNGLLLPTNDFSPLQQESFAFTDELPRDHVTKTTEVWGFLESQETTAVAPKTYGEFVYPYQDRLVQRFGLLSYGCCERVDAIWEDYLSKWKNLRKLSVSPFNDEPKVGQYLAGTRVVYYSKPRAELVTMPGPMDEEAVLDCFRAIGQAASGCLLEVAQREVGTIFGDFDRGRRYVQLAREALAETWKP